MLLGVYFSGYKVPSFSVCVFYRPWARHEQIVDALGFQGYGVLSGFICRYIRLDQQTYVFLVTLVYQVTNRTAEEVLSLTSVTRFPGVTQSIICLWIQQLL